MEPEEDSGVPYSGGDSGAPDTSSTSAGARTADDDVSSESEQECWVPSASPTGAAEDSGSPQLWCHAELRLWEQSERQATSELLLCGACGQSFKDKIRLRTHRCQRPAPSYQCGACGKIFRHQRNLLTHKKHRGRWRHPCSECQRVFCLRGDLLRHRTSHGSEGTHVCPLCARRFRRERQLRDHRRAQHLDGDDARCPLRCQHCQQCFKDESALNRHRCVEEERPFMCERCGRRFSWQESLLIHQRSHSPERSHKCPECGRGFSRSGNLLMHRRVHTGERPFTCTQCDKAFCNKASLINHRRLHRRYRTFVCSRCHVSFSSRGKLRLHLRGHSDGNAVGRLSHK